MGKKKAESSTPKSNIVFDATAGEAALRVLDPALRAIPAAEVATPRLDVQAAALAALALVDVANEPSRKGRFALLPEALFPKDTVKTLETAAWAAWYAHTRVLTESAGTTGAQVDAALYDASGQLLRDMLKLLEYHVGAVPEVATEIADIRAGSGYQDRATDLVRTAALWDHWENELKDDSRLYHPGDSARARAYAEQIVAALRAQSAATEVAWIDLRSRAYTQMSRGYSEVLAAGQFIFRHQPEDLVLFVPLRQVVVPVRRRTGAVAPAPAPAAPDDGNE